MWHYVIYNHTMPTPMKKNPTAQRTVRISSDRAKRAEEIAKQQDRSLRSVLDRALDKGLPHAAR